MRLLWCGLLTLFILDVHSDYDFSVALKWVGIVCGTIIVICMMALWKDPPAHTHAHPVRHSGEHDDHD